MTTREKLDGLLRYFSNISPKKGALMKLEAQDIEELKTKFAFSDDSEIVFFLQGLEERGLVKARITGSVTGASLTMKGYLHLDEL